jgi:hypothetical protein
MRLIEEGQKLSSAKSHSPVLKGAVNGASLVAHRIASSRRALATGLKARRIRPWLRTRINANKQKTAFALFVILTSVKPLIIL